MSSPPVSRKPFIEILSEVLISVIGASLNVLMGLFARVLSDPSLLEKYRQNHALLLDILAVQFEFWTIAACLVVGAIVAAPQKKAELLVPSWIIGSGAFVLIGLAVVAWIFEWGFFLKIGLPDLIGILFIYIAVTAVLTSKKHKKKQSFCLQSSACKVVPVFFWHRKRCNAVK